MYNESSKCPVNDVEKEVENEVVKEVVNEVVNEVVVGNALNETCHLKETKCNTSEKRVKSNQQNTEKKTKKTKH